MPAPILESPLLNLSVISSLLSRPSLDAQERARLLAAKLHLLINTDTNTNTHTATSTTTNTNTNTDDNPNPNPTSINPHPTSVPPGSTTSVKILSKIKDLEHHIEIMQVRLDLARALLSIGSMVEAQVHFLDIISVSGKVLKRIKRKRRKMSKSLSEHHQEERERGEGGGEDEKEEKEEDDEVLSQRVMGLRKEALKEMVGIEEVLGKQALAQRWRGLLRDLEDKDNFGRGAKET